jgi:hypothetical protein
VKRAGWRSFYSVWMSAPGRYEAQCLACADLGRKDGTAERWQAPSAASRVEAWRYAEQHELEKHSTLS